MKNEKTTYTAGITVWVVSGEGEGPGHSRETPSRTARGLKRILTVERCGGDRWAWLEMETPTMRGDRVMPQDVVTAHEAAIARAEGAES